MESRNFTCLFSKVGNVLGMHIVYVQRTMSCVLLFYFVLQLQCYLENYVSVLRCMVM